jgi:hypothetical protein
MITLETAVSRMLCRCMADKIIDSKWRDITVHLNLLLDSGRDANLARPFVFVVYKSSSIIGVIPKS